MNFGAAIMGLERVFFLLRALDNDESAARKEFSKFLFRESCRIGCSSYRAGRSERMTDDKGKTGARAELRVRPVVQGGGGPGEQDRPHPCHERRLLLSLSQLNRVSQAMRQPGSAIKPLSYLAALGKGLQPDTLVLDEPITLPPIGGGRAPIRIIGHRRTMTAARRHLTVRAPGERAIRHRPSAGRRDRTKAGSQPQPVRKAPSAFPRLLRRFRTAIFL